MKGIRKKTLFFLKKLLLRANHFSYTVFSVFARTLYDTYYCPLTDTEGEASTD